MLNLRSSIEQARVWKRLQLEPIGLKRPLASIIAGLCSMKVKDEEGKARYILPQGAPTSPIITNMICDTLDRRLAGLAKRFGLRYSRYADVLPSFPLDKPQVYCILYVIRWHKAFHSIVAVGQ